MKLIEITEDKYEKCKKIKSTIVLNRYLGYKYQTCVEKCRV